MKVKVKVNANVKVEVMVKVKVEVHMKRFEARQRTKGNEGSKHGVGRAFSSSSHLRVWR